MTTSSSSTSKGSARNATRRRFLPHQRHRAADATSRSWASRGWPLLLLLLLLCCGSDVALASRATATTTIATSDSAFVGAFICSSNIRTSRAHYPQAMDASKSRPCNKRNGVGPANATTWVTITTQPRSRKRMALWSERHSPSSRDSNNDNRNDQGVAHHSALHENASTNLSCYLATCIPGLAPVLAQELSQWQCHHIQVTGRGQAAVSFQADFKTVLQVLLWTRTAHKVMELLATTTATTTAIATRTPTDENNNGDNNISDALLLQDRHDLYDWIRSSVHVPDLLGNGRGGLLTLSVQAVLNQPNHIPVDLQHSHFTALTVKNALCDAVRDLRGDRPTVDTENPDVPLVLVLMGHRRQYHSPSNNMYQPEQEGAAASAATASLYRQLHVGSLHRRGYRQDQVMHKAALKESLAAGLLLQTTWKDACQAYGENSTSVTFSTPNLCLVDPMAGSGSLVLEGAMMLADVAPGLMRMRCQIPGSRIPAVLAWKSSRRSPLRDGNDDGMTTWKDLVQQAALRAKNRMQQLLQQRQSSPWIYANDIHPGAVHLLQKSLGAAGLSSLVEVHEGDCANWILPWTSLSDESPRDSNKNWNNDSLPRQREVLVVTNPPWGVRLNNNNNNINMSNHKHHSYDNDNRFDDDSTNDDDLQHSWDSLRIFLKQQQPEASSLSSSVDGTTAIAREAWILSGNPKATRYLALKKHTTGYPLTTGQVSLRWIHYRVHNKNNENTPYQQHVSDVDNDEHSAHVQRSGGRGSLPAIRKNHNNARQTDGSIPLVGDDRSQVRMMRRQTLSSHNPNPQVYPQPQRSKKLPSSSFSSNTLNHPPKRKKRPFNGVNKENEWLIS